MARGEVYDGTAESGEVLGRSEGCDGVVDDLDGCLTGLDVTGGACGLIGCNAMNLTNIRYLVSPVVHG